MSKSIPESTRDFSPKIVIPNRLAWHGQLAVFIGFVAAKVVSATWRVKIEDRSGCLGPAQQNSLIFCTWHNRLALSMASWEHVKKSGAGSRLAALISASKDGALLARLLEYFKVQPIRGSTSRRGPQALREMNTWLEEKKHAAITPDGPRGPRYRVQPGIIMLAQLTGAPIIPMGSGISRKVCLKSWDQFQVPLPFARCDIVFDKPIYVRPEMTEDQREKCRLELEERMLQINRD